MQKAILSILLILGLNFASFGQIETQTQFVIRGEITSDTLLGIPLMVESFDDGRFIVNEYRNNRLKLFDNQGEYIRSISRRGRGPGENLQIEYIYANNQNELLLVDHSQIRLSIFQGFKHKRDVKLPPPRPDITSIHQRSNGNYLVNSRQAGTFLFYEWNSEFKILKNKYVHISEIQTDGNHALTDSEISILTQNTLLTSNDDLIVVPPFYTGNLTVYRDENNYGSPEVIETRKYGPPIALYEGSLRDLDMQDRRKLLLSTISGPDGPTAYFHYNRSLGIFQLSSGVILHLAQIRNHDEDQTQLLAEVLNSNATEILGIYEISEVGDLSINNYLMEGTRHDRINLRFLHLDNDDKLFVATEDSNMEPELHIISISYNSN